MTTGRLNGLSCVCCVFSAVWGAAAQNQKRNKERGKEMDKSLGCDHQYPHRPKPSENSLKDSELNICFIEVICTKRMLLKWCVLSECVCVCEKDRWSEGGKGSAGGALSVSKCKRRPKKSAGFKVPNQFASVGSRKTLCLCKIELNWKIIHFSGLNCCFWHRKWFMEDKSRNPLSYLLKILKSFCHREERPSAQTLI